MASIREWRSNEWESGPSGRDQRELQFMLKKILSGADEIENKPTPGHSRDDLSRVIVAKTSWMPALEYVVHVNGFTVEDITEICRTDAELERLNK